MHAVPISYHTPVICNLSCGPLNRLRETNADPSQGSRPMPRWGNINGHIDCTRHGDLRCFRISDKHSVTSLGRNNLSIFGEGVILHRRGNGLSRILR